ncbi:MAG: S1/P1 nuclease [Gemmatimonadales bacterium]
MRVTLLRALLLVAALPAPSIHHSRPAAALWGPVGHRVIAQVALDRLPAAVADETRRLLDGQNITDIASWADDIRREQPATAPWHYVDIEIIDSSYVPSRDCKEGACVVAALDREIAILGDHGRSDSDRAVALKWVVHLVGDIHQPLHAGERGDRGGNDVHVTFDGRHTNLHALWDSGLITSYRMSDAEMVGRIEAAIAHRKDITALSGGTPAQWAMESHDIARDFVYARLPASLEIDRSYADAARPVIMDQLLKAGVRLAAVLERTLGH